MTLEEKEEFGRKAYIEYQRRQEALQRELEGPTPIDLYFRYMRNETWAGLHRYWVMIVEDTNYIVDIATDQVLPVQSIMNGIVFPSNCKLLGFGSLNLKSIEGKYIPTLDFIKSGRTHDMEYANGRGKYRAVVVGDDQYIPALSRVRYFSEFR